MAPATASSSSPTGAIWMADRYTAGGAPITAAAGIGFPAAFQRSQLSAVLLLESQNTPVRSGDLSMPRYTPALRTPVSGSLVIQMAELKYGALSKPGVEMGTGSSSRPSWSRRLSP